MIATRLRLTAGVGIVALSMIGLGAAAVIGQSTPSAEPNWVALHVPDAEVQNTAPSRSVEKDRVKESESKLAAKGILDDDVPYAGAPSQAVVRYEEGKLIVRQRVRSYVAVTGKQQARTGKADSAPPGQTTKITTYELRSTISGKSIDGKLPHPRELALFKDDTLLVVLPAHAGEVSMSIQPQPPHPWPIQIHIPPIPNIDFKGVNQNAFEWTVRPISVSPSMPSTPAGPTAPSPPMRSTTPIAPILPPAPTATQLPG
jgi:hypothetical protein